MLFSRRDDIQALVTTGTGKFYSNGVDWTWLQAVFKHASSHVDTFINRWHTTTTFVCSLNPIRQTSLPRSYTIISSLSYHHCSSQTSQYLSVSSRAHTRLLNERIKKQRLSPEKRRSQSGTCFVCPGRGLSEFRIKRKGSD